MWRSMGLTSSAQINLKQTTLKTRGLALLSSAYNVATFEILTSHFLAIKKKN